MEDGVHRGQIYPSLSVHQRVHLTWGEKIGIIAKTKVSPGLSYNEIARWTVAEFSFPAAPNKSTIGRLLKAEKELLRWPVEKVTLETSPPSSHVLIDQNVMDFVMLAEADCISLTGTMTIHHGVSVAIKLGLPRTRWSRFGILGSAVYKIATALNGAAPLENRALLALLLLRTTSRK
ncbi:hypothetical protein V7S43_013637 [Phytophthora oleae]|uniref:Uncharacterized protein n=1 Tax=Phytophthora oleae TaxID=2107226 RepID=A0ABD3F7G0_9STRA